MKIFLGSKAIFVSPPASWSKFTFLVSLLGILPLKRHFHCIHKRFCLIRFSYMALVRISSVIFHEGPVISGLSCFQYVNMLLHRGREWPQCIKMSNRGLQCVCVCVRNCRVWNLTPVLSVSRVLSSRTLPCCNYVSTCRKARPSLTASTRRHNYHSERIIWKNMETTICETWKQLETFLHPYSFCSRRKQLLIFKLRV